MSSSTTKTVRLGEADCWDTGSELIIFQFLKTLRKLNVFRAYLEFVARLHLKVSNARDVAQENADASNALPGGMDLRVVQHRRALRPCRQRLRKSKSHQFRDGFRKYSGQARTRQ
jgi:hypothetical protein